MTSKSRKATRRNRGRAMSARWNSGQGCSSKRGKTVNKPDQGHSTVFALQACRSPGPTKVRSKESMQWLPATKPFAVPGRGDVRSIEPNERIVALGFPEDRADIIHAFVGGSALHGVKLKGRDDTDVYGIYIEKPWL